MLSLQTYDAPGTVTGDSIFIPLSALPGVLVTDLQQSVPLEERTSKVTLAIIEQAFSYFATPSNARLGFTATKGNPAGSGSNRITQNYVFAVQLLVNAKIRSISTLPTPISGAGSFSLADIFPGALSLVDQDPVDEGIVFPVANLQDLKDLTPDDINIDGGSDNRQLFDAILLHLVKDRENRSATVPSAIVNGSLSNFASSTIPTTFNPDNSGIDFDNVDSLTILQRSYSLTLELELNQLTQTFDVRVATA
jgi:hypothetical protein